MTGLKEIWVVEGTCGAYEDRTEWPVAFYYTKDDAEFHAEAATNKAKAISEELGMAECGNCTSVYLDGNCRKHKDLKNQWDIEKDLSYADMEDIQYYSYKVKLGTRGLAPKRRKRR